MKILFNLVSAQTAPNYIAIKEINPDKIILFNTDATQNHSLWLKSALKIESETYTIDAYKYSEIYDFTKRTNKHSAYFISFKKSANRFL